MDEPIKGTAYVMKHADEDVFRIGHHTTTNEQREREVNKDSEDQWSIEYSIDNLGSKLKAAAVEALAQAALEDHSEWRPRRAKPTRNQLVFTCSLEQGKAALDAAKDAVEDHLSRTK